MSDDNSNVEASEATPEVAESANVEPKREEPDNKSASPEWLEKELAKVRAEAARYRTERNEYRNDHEELQKIKDAEKTEIERSQERVSALESDLESARRELTIERVARKFGIGEDDLDLLGSGTQEQLEARAERIAALNEKAAASVAPPSNLPKENLVPGSGKGNEPEDDAYPSHWR